MGGSSSINYMIYMRGNRKDYDGWAARGNPGWHYKEVLHYFLKSEDNKDHDILHSNPEYHHRGGYQTVERFPYQDNNIRVRNARLSLDTFTSLDIYCYGYKNSKEVMKTSDT